MAIDQKVLLLDAQGRLERLDGAVAQHQAANAPTGKLYVADTFGDDVGVIDVATGKKIKLLKTGKLPHNLALTRDKQTLYVTESGSQSVTAYDTTKDEPLLQRVVGLIPDNAEHRAVGMDKVRQATSCKDCHWQRSVGSFISGIALSPDEQELWITEMKTQMITVVDAKTLETKRQVEVINPEGTTPSNVVYHPKTKDVYVLNRTKPDGKTLTSAAKEGDFDHDARKGNSFITVYDPSFTTVKARILVPYAVPFGAVFSPDGRELYVTYRSTNKIAVIDTERFTLARSIISDEAPIGLLLAPDTETLMVANFYETPATVQWLDRRSGTPMAKIEVPSSPTLMVRHPNTGMVYMTASGSNRIIEIDPWKRAITRQFEAGAYPIDIQIVP
ncbi:MAG: beta-propeller fold lactonase family protein [Candidatus Sericytochromatia bacterium]